MRESMMDILEYVQDVDFPQFTKDKMRVDAVIRKLEILGEAAAKVGPRIQDQYPEIEWSRMYKTRNRLAHDYYRIDLEIVWRIIENYLPQNLIALDDLLKNELGDQYDQFVKQK